MNIKKTNLQDAIDFSPTKRSQTMTISDLSQKIEEGRITVPMYQRGLSWNDDKIVALFNYELFGKAPVAPISFNSIGSNNDVPQLSFVTRNVVDAKNVENGTLSVVDGQQRLTTNYRAYSNDATLKHVVLDVSKPAFKVIKKEPRDNQIPVGILLNKNQEKLSDYLYSNLSVKDANELFPILIGIRGKLLGYSYTIHIAENMTENEQIGWFEVLNNAGSRVSMIELTLSKMKVHDFDMYNYFIKPYKTLVERYGYENLFSPFSSSVSYPIASLNPAFEIKKRQGKHSKNYAPIPSDTKEKMLIKLNKYELEELSSDTLKALETSLKFIDNNNLSSEIKNMQQIMFMTGYFIFNSEIKREGLIEWVKNTNFDNITNGQRRSLFADLINNDF